MKVKVYGWFEKCPDDIHSIWMIWKESRWSAKCLDDLEIVWMIWKMPRWSKDVLYIIAQTEIHFSCALSGKFLRGQFCYLESVSFFWLCWNGGGKLLGACSIQHIVYSSLFTNLGPILACFFGTDNGHGLDDWMTDGQGKATMGSRSRRLGVSKYSS